MASIVRHDPTARPLWVLECGGLRVEAEIASCPLGDWLRVWEGDALAFGMIATPAQAATIDAEADEHRRAYERRGFVAVRPH